MECHIEHEPCGSEPRDTEYQHPYISCSSQLHSTAMQVVLKDIFEKLSDINSPMVDLEPRGTKSIIRELISEKFVAGAPW